MFDLEKVREDANALEVAEYLGLEVIKSGKNHYIRCPEHIRNIGKADRSIGNCILSEKGYHCFACGGKGDAIKLAQLTENIDFIDAVNVVIEAVGGNFSDYTVRYNRNNHRPHEQFPLSSQDLVLLGLKKCCYGILPKTFIQQKEDCPENWRIYPNYSFLRMGADVIYGYDAGPGVKYSLIELWNDDREGFNELIKNKIKENQAMYCAALDSGIVFDLYKDRAAAVKAEYGMMENLEKINNLANKFGVPILKHKKKQQGRFFMLRAAH